MNYVLNFLRNIKYLMTHVLLDKEDDLIYDTLNRVEDFYRYEIMDNNSEVNTPVILNCEKTIDKLLREPKCMVRFGDGELNLIMGHSIPFQKYEKALGDKLLYILRQNDPDLYIGINYFSFHSNINMMEYTRKFNILYGKMFRQILLNNCDMNQIFLATEFNQQYIGTKNLDYEKYYKNLKNLFAGKDVVVFAGEGTLNGITYDVLELAKGKEYIFLGGGGKFLQPVCAII